MLRTFGAEVIEDRRRMRVNFSAFLLFAIEDTERIFFKSRLAVITKPVEVRREIFFQGLVVGGAAGRTADGIDAEFDL